MVGTKRKVGREAVVGYAALLLVVPMAVLNPFGREAFVGYYAGIIAMWATFVLAGRLAPEARV